MTVKKIAVLGGGMSSLVSLFELTNQPNWSVSYDITVYQTGWRLGGKGASGRNKRHHMRNEEHGLHVVFGFYDNVFRIMKQCYDELGRNPSAPLATWKDAFKPHSLVVMMDKLKEDEYSRWILNWPTNDQTPGEGGPVLPPWEYVLMAFKWALRTIEQFFTKDPTAEHDETVFDDDEHSPITVFERLPKDLQSLEAHIDDFLSERQEPERRGIFSRIAESLNGELKLIKEHSALPLAVAYSHALHKDPLQHNPESHAKLLALIERFMSWLNSHSDLSDAFRRARILLNFGFAMIRGLIIDRVIFPPIDWFKIDDKDFLAWLKEHGARPDTLDSSPAHGVYSAVFSENEKIGAGTGAHALLRMALGYKGAYLWMMQAGMGDTIFVPLMKVLEQRGVKFKFFHLVEQLHLSTTPGTRYVDSIDFTIQANVIREPYQALIDVKGLPCWPTEPLFDQLVEGEAIETGGFNLEDWWTAWPGVGKITLQRGKDFDLVILGISVAALPALCTELVDDPNNPRFKEMVNAVKTTQSQAVQLWMHPELPQFGWPPNPPVVVPYGYSTPTNKNPLDTWADMTHLIPFEDWPESMRVGNIAYLTAGLTDEEPIAPRSDHGYPARQRKRVENIARSWLKKCAGPLWPKSVTPNKKEFNWSWLVDPLGRTGEDRLLSQYWHADNSLSERYVIAVPNSNFSRLRANESGYPNLILTGDWIKTALSVGCLEAATMGGIQAAQAIDPNVPPAAADWLPPMSTSPTYSTLQAPSDPSSSGDAKPTEASAPVDSSTKKEDADKPRVKYIERDGDLIASPPVKLVTTLYMFTLYADMNKLREMCDRELNLPGSPTVYRPLAPFVVAYFSEINNLPLSNPLGWVLERDFGFWVPVVAGKMRGGFFIPERVLTYTPYIWVDSGVALIGGRTVFGFPKEMGTMTFPRTPKDPPRFTLDATVMKKFSPESQDSLERLMSVYRKDTTAWLELQDQWKGAEQLADAALEGLKTVLDPEAPLADAKFIRQFFTQLSVGTPVVFLKQTPAADDATRAVYQAVIESSIDITGGLKGGILWGEFNVDLFSYDSIQIVKTLGLSPSSTDGNRATVKSLFQTWMKFDAVVQPGKTIWQTT